MARTALLDSVTLERTDDAAGAFTVSAFDLGDSTGATPNPQQQGTALGVERRAVRGFNVVVASLLVANFETLNDWQIAGDLLTVTFNYADGTSVAVKRVGFTVMEDEAAALGTLLGWTLNGAGYALTPDGMLTVLPALPVAA